MAAAALLAGAGEAPRDDLGGVDPLVAVAVAPAPVTIEALPEPDLAADAEPGPYAPLEEAAPEQALPAARSLAALVGKVRAMPGGAKDGAAMTADLNCLATAVYFEAKGEPLDGQLAVAQVILNRVEDGRFGRDVCGVVKAPRQFSFVRQGAMPAPRGAAQWETARAIAVIALSDGWRDVVGDATHFHATYVNPRWRMQRVAQVGAHIFYR